LGLPGYAGVFPNPMLAQALVMARDLQLVGDAGRLLRDPPIAAIPAGTTATAIKNLQPNIRGMLADAEAMQGIAFSKLVPDQFDEATVCYREKGNGENPLPLLTIKRLKDPGMLQAQLRLVLSYADLRGERANEILSQVVPQTALWSGVAGLQPERHQYTYELLGVALRFSNAVVQQMKLRLNFPRPMEVSPLVLPMLLTPGHSSFPSGHSTEAHCAAELLSGIFYRYLNDANEPWGLPTEEKSKSDKEAKKGQCDGQIHHAGSLRHQLLRVAYRVAENRVVAGLHYPMDSLSGQVLGITMAHHFLWRAAPIPEQNAASPPQRKANPNFLLYGNAGFDLQSGSEEPILDKPLDETSKTIRAPAPILDDIKPPASPVLNWLFSRAVDEWKR
jgi:membrane-associated phospholipid phosphatase